VARPGDLQLPEFPQIDFYPVDAPEIAANIYDQLHLDGHAASPVPDRLRMFRRGLSTRRS
jgi:hypothetical protein